MKTLKEKIFSATRTSGHAIGEKLSCRRKIKKEKKKEKKHAELALFSVFAPSKVAIKERRS